MTFQQKNFAVSLVNFTLILIFYLFRLFQMNQNGTFIATNVFWLWGIIIVFAVVVTIAATIITHMVVAAIDRVRTGEASEIDDFKDERDDLIDLKGTKITYFLSSIGSFFAMLTYVFGQSPLIMFTLLIFFGLVAQIVGDITRLRLYQQGF